MNIFAQKNIYLLSFTAIMLTALFSVGFLHPDEQYYTLDFAFSKLGILEHLGTWELDSKIRPWTLPYFITFILYPFKVAGINNPFTLATIARLASGLLGFYTLVKFSNSFRRFFTNDTFKYFQSFSLLFYPLIFMSVRTSSDNWATCFFVLALARLLKDAEIKVRDLVISGLLLGLSFSLRHQTGLLSLSLGLWLLYKKKVSIRDWFLNFSFFILLGVLIGFGFDYLGYGELTLTPLNYLKENLIEDKISGFGVMPWWGYIKLSLKSLHLFSLPLLVVSCVYIYKKRSSFASWVFIPFLIFHSSIGHKELRFIYPLLFLTLFMLFHFIDAKKYHKVLKTFFVINFIFLIGVCFKPAYTPLKFYQFLYNFKSNEQLKLYTFKDRKGVYPDLEMLVYKRPKTQLIQSDQINENEFYTFTTKYSDFELINTKYKCSQLYISYPSWVLKFNPFNWRDRSNIWALSSCKLK
ncbi:hypothetical protein [Halobacteriovorax sp. HLS]|uniref:hypothetical protein n=1 Tax=Halobacteriovorax sp. HLS TaxID=2234000 RepID=UPI0013E2FA68|nr:hypothetical protein [Halobacteriovorax sp. HLS]